MEVKVRSEAEAIKLARRTLLKPGWYPGRITDALDKPASIELGVAVEDRTLRTWLNNSDRGAALLRHCCQACGDEVFARYQAGEVDQSDFPAHDLEVKVGIQKGTRAYPGDKNVIEDFRPLAADSRIVNLRETG